MLILAQAVGEYGGAEGGILGALMQWLSTAVESARSSVAEHPVIWGIGACVAAWLLFRRR